jgi:hypothetical protein
MSAAGLLDAGTRPVCWSWSAAPGVWGEEVGVGVGERSRKRPALGLGLGQLGLDRQSSSLLGFFLAGNRETPVALLLPVVSTEFHHRRAPASSL